MKSFNKIVLNAVASLLLASAAVLVFSNLSTSIELYFLDMVYPKIPVGVALIIVGLLVGSSLSLKLLEMLALVKRQTRHADQHVERAELTSEIASDKVKVLEAKVDSLEKALAKALERSTPAVGQ